MKYMYMSKFDKWCSRPIHWKLLKMQREINREQKKCGGNYDDRLEDFVLLK